MLHTSGVVVHDHNHNRGIRLPFSSTGCHSPSRPQSGRPACPPRSPAESGNAGARRRRRSAVQPSGSFAPHRSALERKSVLLPCEWHVTPITHSATRPSTGQAVEPTLVPVSDMDGFSDFIRGQRLAGYRALLRTYNTRGDAIGSDRSRGSRSHLFWNVSHILRGVEDTPYRVLAVNQPGSDRRRHK